MNGIYNTIRKHALNIPGKRLDRKFVVFESDDWGSERIPGKNELNYLIESGFDVYQNPFNHLDSLETEADLQQLFEVLRQFQDKRGNHPVITANTIVANPDFQYIRNSGFHEYRFESVLQTYSRKKETAGSFDLILEGMREGVYHPQFHGREHLNVKQWLNYLKDGDLLLTKAFEAGIYGIDLDLEHSKRSNFMAAFDSDKPTADDHTASILKEGTDIFEELFGFRSQSFIAPCYVWHPGIENYLYQDGIRYLQGLPFQLAPNESSRYRKIIHYQGQRNRHDQLYFVRNSFFEPSLNERFDWISDILKRLKIIFQWKKPAIIGTHRINFSGSLNEENRRRNLLLLQQLLQALLKTWPDIEFTTTDKLGEHYRNS